MSERNDLGTRKLRVVVCGTTFGQVYLSALSDPAFPFELIGIVARGSARSRAAAERSGVPLFTDPARIPKDTDIACVVVRSSAMGGSGTTLAKYFMTQGINVMQEHPIHHDELAECVAIAHRHRVVYFLNTFYPQLQPVRQFIRAARLLIPQARPLYIDAACAIQVAYSLFDILSQLLGGVRPWTIAEHPPRSELVRELAEAAAPFRSLEGVLGGVPLTLRVQNQTDPADPDNHLHLLHRVTLGTQSGNLTLVNTHGPIVWSPSMYIPESVKNAFDFRSEDARYLDIASAASLNHSQTPSYRHILSEMWPNAIRSALLEFRQALLIGDDLRNRAQSQLALCQLWRDVTNRLGYPEIIRGEVPAPFSLEQFVPAAEELCGVN